VILVASGENDTSIEYPAIKQISLGPKIGLRDIGIEVNNEAITFDKMSKLLELGAKSYKRVYEIYKSVAEEYNTDLFFCDLLLNDACIDIAHALKKPVVGFTSGLRSNYKTFFFPIFILFYIINNILLFSYFILVMDPKPYKSDPMFGCSISLENASILERFRCNFIQPLLFIYSFNSIMNQINDVRKQLNIEPGNIALGRGVKSSLVLIDTFFGFEVIINK
jgi:hypothetical protein